MVGRVEMVSEALQLSGNAAFFVLAPHTSYGLISLFSGVRHSQQKGVWHLPQIICVPEAVSHKRVSKLDKREKQNTRSLPPPNLVAAVCLVDVQATLWAGLGDLAQVLV